MESITQIAPTQALARTLAERLNQASIEAVHHQEQVVQLAWDLGDVLQTEKTERPDTFAAFIEGAKIPDAMARHACKVRAITDDRSTLHEAGVMRQALFELLVPAKEKGEERVELAPPQDWRRWVNGARIWARKLEVGLTKIELESFVRETESVWNILVDARRKLEEGR